MADPHESALRPARREVDRGRYFTIPQAVEAYPGVLTERLIAFTYAGRRVVLAEADIEAYLEANRREPLQPPGVAIAMGLSSRPRPPRSRSA
jgi:hypothetical protein